MTEVVLDDGTRATIESLDGDRVVLHSARAAPPGAMLHAKLPDAQDAFGIKVRACRREAGHALFRIEGRCVNLPRADRERLAGR